MFPTDQSLELENINTSTFGPYYQQNKSNLGRNNTLEHQSSIVSKMNQRYTNQLLQSDSSIGENIINGNLLIYNIFLCIDSVDDTNIDIPITIRDSIEIIPSSHQSHHPSLESSNYDHFVTDKSHLTQLNTISEPQFHQLMKYKLNTLYKIISRLDQNTQIYQMKVGMEAFLRN